MKLKKYLQFIKESSEFYWITQADIKNIFQFILDEEYKISTKQVFYGHYGVSDGEYLNPNSNPSEELKLFDISRDDIILSGEEYYPGWKIEIESSLNSEGDFTEDLQSAISQLKGRDLVIKVIDDDGNTNIENLHLIDGDIITWVPEIPNKPFTTNTEEMSDGDIYIESTRLQIIAYQPESIKVSEKMLAETYKWEYDRVSEKGHIFCHIDIDDMARAVLSTRSYEHWGKLLQDGIDVGDYYDGHYMPDINSVIGDLDKENEILFIKCLIKELGGLESFISQVQDNCSDEAYTNIKDKSEDDIIKYLLTERFKRTLETICKDSEIFSEVQQTIADWERQAHCDANQKELEEDFDELVEKEIGFTEKFYKEVQLYYTKKVPTGEPNVYTIERVPYKQEVIHYEVAFENKWLEDYGKCPMNCKLSQVFWEWCHDMYFENSLNPRFTDLGDVDRPQLNIEIKGQLNYFLKN